MKAQEIKNLTLEDAVNFALTNSDASKIADAKVNSAEGQLNVTKNLQYPDVDISGQYRYLTGADVKLRTQSSDSVGGGGSAQPKVNSLLLGQANVTMPIFSGFKLKNTIKAGENLYNAAQFNAKNNKEQIALQTIQDYLNLYKAKKTIELVQENLKSAQRRVTDFSNMEENGLLARNDLLKAKLQQSNIEISLEEAKKNERILNFKLAVMLKLPENTLIKTSDSNFGITPEITSPEISRNDLQAIEFQKEAAKDQIKVAQSAFYPSLALVGGYIALDLHDALTVTNAMNIGVGVSYNLANLFKTKSDVKLAKSKVQELEYTVNMASDKIKVQIENAKQDYELSKKKFEVYTQSEEQAIENYRIVKDKYDNGLSDTNDLLEADVQQLQAKIDLAYAQANITQKYYELLTAEGILTNQFNQNNQ
ncbi:TolC family protein [Aequorivita sublithincola]|nr:TolC family protein [Aequorivita sublithincola]